MTAQAHAHSQAQMDREVQARPVRPDPQAIIHGSPALNLADIIQGHTHGPGLQPGLLASQLHLPPHPVSHQVGIQLAGFSFFPGNVEWGGNGMETWSVIATHTDSSCFRRLHVSHLDCLAID